MGISAALSATGQYNGEILMSSLPIQAPRFNLPSTAHLTEYLHTSADSESARGKPGDIEVVLFAPATLALTS